MAKPLKEGFFNPNWLIKQKVQHLAQMSQACKEVEMNKIQQSLWLHITQSAYKARFEDRNNGSQSEASEIEELVMALLSIKRRMIQEPFFSLLSLIDNHPIFHNNSNNGHVRKWKLYHFPGLIFQDLQRRSNPVCVYLVTSVTQFLWLIFIPLSSSKYVVWPNNEAQEEIVAKIGDFGFKSCVGFINGTLLPLDQKPVIDPQDYYLRKGSYSISTPKK
ncbi:uncharacterized protein VP01_3473g3 [Puccinia sorghi]|uniref:Uncharacterized protein n=1 Tax=Puccinia sorghi TaxID=27349 RepID=A0A0L6UWU1_9BASI|nr:uncharacterized protein VP01_3473g3 [Puccinia sorghi]